MDYTRFWSSALTAALILTLAWPAHAQTVTETVIEESIASDHETFRIVQVVEGLEHPWAVNFLPDDRMLITERPARMHIVDGDEITQLEGLPQVDAEEDQATAPEGGNQGGLLDVVPHPNFEQNGWIYMTYSSPGDDDAVTSDDDYGTGTALARARISDDSSRLEDLETIYAQAPRVEPGRHYGSRIVFLDDGTLLFSIGDRGIRTPSQDLTDPAGSMIRLYHDGAIPEDNPFVGMEPGNLRPEIFSFGHRNNQGLAIHPQTGDIWTTEHGPSGGDVLHRVEMGLNYGWPQVTQGRAYSTGEFIGVGSEAPGVEAPVHVWEDAIAPSGLAIYDGDAFPSWRGHLLAGGLLQEKLIRLEISDDTVVAEEDLLHEHIGRIRDVRQGPDGYIYLATDEGDGGIFRLEPAQ